MERSTDTPYRWVKDERMPAENRVADAKVLVSHLEKYIADFRDDVAFQTFARSLSFLPLTLCTSAQTKQSYDTEKRKKQDTLKNMSCS